MLLSALAIHAQDLDSICSSHVKNLGGALLQEIGNIVIEQTAYFQNMEVPQVSIIIPGKVYYQEMTFPGGKIVVSVKDGKGWTLNTFASEKGQDLPPNDATMYMANSQVFGPIYDYYVNKEKAIVKEISLEGTRKIDRDNCHKLKVVYKTGFTTYVYLSTESGMIRKSENNFGDIEYSNYKKVDGVMFPFLVSMTNANGNTHGEVTRIKLNAKIDHARFEKP
jgi:hypothetical protein